MMDIKHYYGLIDADVRVVLDAFEEFRGSIVLNVGANEEHLSNILADNGYDVTGIDLLPYTDEAHLPLKFRFFMEQPDGHPESMKGEYYNKAFAKIPRRYKHVVGDFCVEYPQLGLFDSVVSTSAIEHFGMADKKGNSPWYGATKLSPTYDIEAMKAIWACLKPGGTAYITVPYGREFIEQEKYYRVYDKVSLGHRIIGKFTVERMGFFLSHSIQHLGACGEWISEKDADGYRGIPPHVTVFLKLKKNEPKPLRFTS